MKYRLLLVFFMFIAPTALRAQSQNPMAMAAQAFQAKDYARAIDLLQKAYKADPNPAFLFNIARSYEKWGRYGYAAKYYKRIIRGKSTPEALKNKALEAFQRVHPKIPATVTIKCNPAGARLVVDGKAHGTCPGRITHAPGTVAISVHAKGFEPWKTSLSVVPEGNSSVVAILQKLPEPAPAIRSNTKPVEKHLRPVYPVMAAKIKPAPNPAPKALPERPVQIVKKGKPRWPGVLLGLGVAVAIGGGVLQGLAYKERMDVKNNRTKGIIAGYTQQDVLDKENKAHKYLTGAYVMYGVGAAAVIGGIIWYVLTPKHNTTVSAYFNGSSMAIGVTHAF